MKNETVFQRYEFKYLLTRDQQARLLKRPAQLVCTALLVFSNTQEQGEFLDFEIRGERL